MNPTRRTLLTALAGALLAAPSHAQSGVTGQVTMQLEQQGFVVVDVRRTLLGRVRIVAHRGVQVREIVFDPRNGAILRDYVTRVGPPGSSDPGAVLLDPEEDPDEEDDDEEEYEEEYDEEYDEEDEADDPEDD